MNYSVADQWQDTSALCGEGLLPVRISGVRNVGAPYVNVISRSGCFNSRVHNHAQKLNHILGAVSY